MVKSWKSNYAALLTALLFSFMGWSFSNPVIPFFLEDDLGVRDPQALKLWVGLSASGLSFTMAIFAPIWGHLADIFSRRTMLLRSIVGNAVIIPLMFFVKTPVQVMLLRTLLGCMGGTLAAATVMTVGIVPAAHVGLALGLIQTCVAVGNALGPLAGGLMADLFGNRVTFLGTSVFYIIAGLIILKFVEKDKPPESQKEKTKFNLLPDFKPVLNSPLLITLLLITFAIQAVNTIATPMLPLYVKELVIRGTETPRYISSISGLILGIGAVTTALGAVISGKICSRVGYWKMLNFCLIAGAIMTIPQALVVNVIWLAVFRALSMFFIGGVTPVQQTLLAATTEKKHQGTVYGLNASVSQTGSAAGPMIGSALAMIGYRAAFLGSAAILGLSSFISFRRMKKNKESARPRN